MDESEWDNVKGKFMFKKALLLQWQKIEEMFNEVGLAEFSQIL